MQKTETIEQHRCPCQSGEVYSSCCEPLITGSKEASTAEGIMRSRYTAYVVKNADYLLKTWHSSTRPEKIQTDNTPEWCRLQILHTENGGKGDSKGIVEYKATAIAGKKVFILHEISRFTREKNQWFYVDGEILGSREIAGSKIGRNEPCPCGSGRKFKSCCGI